MFKKTLQIFLCIIIFNQNLLNAQALTKNNINTETLDFDCAPKIKILSGDGDQLDFLGIARWSFLFSQPTIIYIDENFNENSVDCFIVEVKDGGFSDNQMFVDLVSLPPIGNDALDQINSLKLVRVGTTNKFQSEPIIIVTDNDVVDDNFDEDNFPPDEDPPADPAWDNIDDIDIDPTVYGLAGGRIKVSINSDQEEEIDICGEALKTVAINVFIMQKNGIPYAEEDIVEAQMQKVVEQMGMACLKINYNIEPLEVGTGVDLSNGLYLPSTISESDEMKNLIQPIKDLDPSELKIDIIFINHFTGTTTRGSSLRDQYTFPPNFIASHTRTILIASDNAVLLTVAHEVGHILTNRGHYMVDYDVNNPNNPNNNPEQFYYINLMKSGVAPLNGVFESKRLEDYQVDWLRGSGDTGTNIPQ